MSEYTTNQGAPFALQTVDITKRFGQTTALAGVSLSVAKGEALAIMGPSGSGKSTLLHCLSGVLKPDSGGIYFNGSRFDNAKDRTRSRLRLSHFGFIFQDGQLIPELPARENVALPLMVTGTSRAKALQAADATLDKVGIGNLRDRRPGDMSGGQAQRVAVARALVGQPDVIFADEPTGALDQATGHEVMQLLTTMVSMLGTSLVLVTHDTQVAGWCRRLVEIRDGLVHSDRKLAGASQPDSQRGSSSLQAATASQAVNLGGTR